MLTLTKSEDVCWSNDNSDTAANTLHEHKQNMGNENSSAVLVSFIIFILVIIPFSLSSYYFEDKLV